MAKLISDLQLLLANRLGSPTAPTDTVELAKRRRWFWEAISSICSDEYMWFLKTYATDTAVDYVGSYAEPTRFRQMIEVKVDNNIYHRTTKEAYDAKKQTALVTLPSISLEREYYHYDGRIYFSPSLTAPTAISVSGITQSGGTATATTATAHGFTPGQYVTIAGADQSGYNGAVQIVSVPSTTTFTYAVDSGTVTPATGTITATLKNIEYWFWQEATEPTAESSAIIIPDKYTNAPVAYAEGRYWSTAHKRGKAADGFTEYETIVASIKRENFRRKFGQNDEATVSER